MAKIHLLTEDLINKIAAGEVVERPASVVKELVENSLDANAEGITLNIENGGLNKIEVIDNGYGMDEIDSQMALKQHATSKIIHLSDLEEINTFGFRGEALASIASVSDTYIHTFTGNGNPSLTYIDDQKIITEIGKGRQIGTTITILNLFAHIPARRKFLKSPSTEYKYILNIFTAIAIGNTKHGFKLIKDSKTIYNLPKNQELSERIITLFPNLNNKDLVPVFFDSPNIKISGFVVHPSKARHDTGAQFVFINNRFVKDNIVNKAVREGFSSTLMVNSYPSFFINISINPSEIDVNIHPRKLEVRFSDSSSIFSSIRMAVERAIKTTLQEELTSKTGGVHLSNPLSNNHYPSSIKESLNFTQSILSLNTASVPRSPRYVKQEGVIEVGYETLAPQPFQLFNTYIFFEKENKILVIDQHAADERVNYEKITNQMGEGITFTTSDLLIPIELRLNKGDIESLKIHRKHMVDMGFAYTLSESKAQFTQIPQIVNNDFNENTLTEILSALNEEERSETTLNTKNTNLIATLACHSSIRAGQKLSTPEMQQLIDNLFNCQLPYSCPHGRPIIWELTKYELEKNFKRKV